MYLENLLLQNFRNYSSCKVEFDRNINVIHGPNARGKTNILESIFLSAMGRSHRQSKDKELILLGNKFAKVNTNFFARGRSNNIEILLGLDRKKSVKANMIPLDKISRLIGLLNVVIFCPEDTNIIKGAPSDRRRFLNFGISQIKPSYFKTLSDYNKVLFQRNKLLKSRGNYTQIAAWDVMLCQLGAKLTLQRMNYVDEISKAFRNSVKNISEEIADIKYISGISSKCSERTDDIENLFSNLLARNRDKDQKYCQTLIGPHRDDLNISINSMNSKIYSSQGQQKTLALALKMSELEVVQKSIKESPILLLDDIFSDLDAKRQQFLLNNMVKTQVIITCTDTHKFDIMRNIKYIDIETLNREKI